MDRRSIVATGMRDAIAIGFGLVQRQTVDEQDIDRAPEDADGWCGWSESGLGCDADCHVRRCLCLQLDVFRIAHYYDWRGRNTVL